MRDLSGSMRDMCGAPDFNGDSRMMPLRGGAWNTRPIYTHLAYRFGWNRALGNLLFSFRLVKDLPAPAAAEVEGAPDPEQGAAAHSD